MNGRVTGPRHLWGLVFFRIPLAPRLFLGGPLAFGVLCGGRDCSSPRRLIHMSLQLWPSTVDFFTYPSRPMSISGQ
eukprot:scaffold68898_cov72-Cyclotella_meneghiniana.AAC.1